MNGDTALARVADTSDRLAGLYRACATLEQGLIINRAQMYPQALEEGGSVAAAERLLGQMTATTDAELARIRGEIRVAELELGTLRWLIEHNPDA